MPGVGLTSCNGMIYLKKPFKNKQQFYSQLQPTVTREKYLGITISNDLNWSTHRRTLGPMTIGAL